VTNDEMAYGLGRCVASSGLNNFGCAKREVCRLCIGMSERDSVSLCAKKGGNTCL
jgi:hypothetical protein